MIPSFQPTGLVSGISLSWTELRASDLAGRARAWQALVKGGMPLPEATQIAGLMLEE